MTKYIDKVLNWIWLSSANPNQVGMTAKSSLLVVFAALVQVLGLTHLQNIPDISNQLTNGANTVSTVITDVLMLVGAIGGVVGVIRKLFLTFTGKNVAVTTVSSS